jgi:hypothetical protein
MILENIEFIEEFVRHLCNGQAMVLKLVFQLVQENEMID